MRADSNSLQPGEVDVVGTDRVDSCGGESPWCFLPLFGDYENGGATAGRDSQRNVGGSDVGCGRFKV